MTEEIVLNTPLPNSWAQFLELSKRVHKGKRFIMRDGVPVQFESDIGLTSLRTQIAQCYGYRDLATLCASYRRNASGGSEVQHAD